MKTKVDQGISLVACTFANLFILSVQSRIGTCLLINIRKTCPCNVYPLKPHFYIAKLGYAGVYLFFLVLLQNIDCGHSLEPPRVPTINVLSKTMKNIKFFSSENFHFYNQKIFCILHGQVFVIKKQNESRLFCSPKLEDIKYTIS